MTSRIFQNVKSRSPWVFSFLWLLNILNTFSFEGFQFNSNLRFYSRAFWNSVFSRCFHRTSRWPKERVTSVWKKLLIQSLLTYCEKCLCEYLLVQKGERINFYSRSEFQMFSLISSRHYCVPLRDTTMAFFLLSSINFCKTFWRLTRVRKIADLRLGKVDKLLISYNIINSWLFLFSGFDFIFSLRDSENQH